MWDWLEAAGDAVVNGVIVGMGMVGLVQEAPERYALDTMMAGFADGCEVSAELEDFWWSAINGERLVLPDDARYYFSDMQVRRDEDFRELRIPVKGSWMGHNVDYFAFFAGNENGISILSVRFDPADEGVHATFPPLAEASAAKLTTDPENFTEVSTAFVSEGGVSQFYCDYST